MIRSLAFTSGFMVMCLAAASVAYAQESSNRVDAKTDWSIFVENQPYKECWVVSKPTEWVATRAGRVVPARRSEILLLVTYRPSQGMNGEVQFMGGYPFKQDSTVSLQIGNETFDLFVDGEDAWPASAAEDAKIRNALKRGAEATITGVSARGTTTKDKFSLSGFTAALAEAEKRCA